MPQVNRRDYIKLLGALSCSLLAVGRGLGRTIRRTSSGHGAILWRAELDRLHLLNPRTGSVVGSLLAPEARLANEQEIHAGGATMAQGRWAILRPLKVESGDGRAHIYWGGTAPFEVIQHFETADGSRAVHMTVEVQWTGKGSPAATTNAEVWVKIPCQMQAMIRAGVSFPFENWRCEPMVLDLPDNFSSWRAFWGDEQFKFEEGPRNMYLPLAAFSANRQQYLSILLGVRSSFTVDVQGDRIWLSRKFFVAPRHGARDAVLELHDGLPPAPHEVFFSVMDRPGWEDLYWDLFLAQYREFTNAPAIRLPNVMAAGSDFPLNAAWTRRLYSYGVRMLNPNGQMQWTTTYLRQKGLLNLSLAEKMGMVTYMGLNRFAYDASKFQGGAPPSALRPQFAWENVRDSLILGPDGKPCDAWNGKAVNMSPQFSYARRILAAARQRFRRVPYQGVFVDYYYATNPDHTHHYGGLPFYPQATADLWFLRKLSDVAHKHGHFMFVNGLPPLLMSSQHFYDVSSCDCPCAMTVQFKLQSVFKPFVHYGGSTYPANGFTTEGWLRNGFRGLLYGAAVPAWSFQPEGADQLVNNVNFLVDPERGRPLFARNGYLDSRLAVSAAVAGDYDKNMWALYRHREGSVYAVTVNDSAETVRRHVPLNGRHVRLSKATKYARIEWDMERGGQTLSEPLGGDTIAAQGWDVELAPYQIKMLCLEPYKKPLSLSYFAELGSDFAWVRSATDRIISADVLMDAPPPGPLGYHGSAKYTMQGWPGVQFEMQLGYRPNHPPAYLSVAGAREYAVQWKDGIIKVWGTQKGNVSVVVDPAQGGAPIAEGQVVTISDAFQKAAVIYDSNQAFRESDWQFSHDAWSTQGKTLHLPAPTATMASAIWKGTLHDDYQITFQTALVLATTKPRSGHRAVCPDPLLQFLVGKQAGEPVWIGTDPANAIFPCLIQDGRPTERGLETTLYPDPYWPEYLRAYDWRIRRQDQCITLAISYDGGLTFEDLMSWKTAKSLMPQFGVACKNAACTIQNITIRTGRM